MTTHYLSPRPPRRLAALYAATLLAAMLLAATLSASTASAQFAIPRCVFGSGGTEIAGTDNRIAGTLGQTLAGVALGTSHRDYVGFWWTLTPISIGVESAAAAPQAPSLAQNYPNPFRDRTTIGFRIGMRAPVRLSILDMLGRERCVLVDGILDPGSYSVRFGTHGAAASSAAREEFTPGLYLIRLIAGVELRSVRCVLYR